MLISKNKGVKSELVLGFSKQREKRKELCNYCALHKSVQGWGQVGSCNGLGGSGPRPGAWVGFWVKSGPILGPDSRVHWY